MSNWLLIIVIFAAAGIFYTLYQRNQASGRPEARLERPPVDRDYQKEREEARLAHLSEDDRAWEAASLERNLANQRVPNTPAE